MRGVCLCGMCCWCLEGRVSGGSLACSFRRWAAAVPERAAAAERPTFGPASTVERNFPLFALSLYCIRADALLSCVRNDESVVQKVRRFISTFSRAGAAPHRRPLPTGIDILPVTPAIMQPTRLELVPPAHDLSDSRPTRAMEAAQSATQRQTAESNELRNGIQLRREYNTKQESPTSHTKRASLGGHTTGLGLGALLDEVEEVGLAQVGQTRILACQTRLLAGR